jgi:hypothetical protein
MDRVSSADQSTADPTADPTRILEAMPEGTDQAVQTVPNQAVPNQAITNQTDAQLESRIDPEVEAVIQRYFETFNAGNFPATAALFATEGAMHPPFESAVVGQDAIAAYLDREAKGMQIEARQLVQGFVQELAETDETAVNVAGKVQTPLFGVNVRWTFSLNDRLEILSVRIKLLAALEDLLKLKS